MRSAERMMGGSEASGTGESLADLAMERVVKDEAGMKRVHDGSGGGDNDDDDDLYGGIGVSKRSKRAHLALHSFILRHRTAALLLHTFSCSPARLRLVTIPVMTSIQQYLDMQLTSSGECTRVWERLTGW